MLKLSENLFVETQYTGCNIGWLNTDQGIVLIDTPVLPHDVHHLNQQFDRQTVAYTVYTHEHFDHILGGGFFNGRIIANCYTLPEIEYLRKNLSNEVNKFFPVIYGQYKEYFDSVKVVNPQILFDEKLTLNMENRIVELSHVGGHSRGSILVLMPKERVLFAGDNVNFGMPYVAPQPNFKQWIELLKRILEMDVNIIVPGHGEICSKDEAIKFLRYFSSMYERVCEHQIRGESKLDLTTKLDLSDCVPTPMTGALKSQVAYHISLMYDEVAPAR